MNALLSLDNLYKTYVIERDLKSSKTIGGSSFFVVSGTTTVGNTAF